MATFPQGGVFDDQRAARGGRRRPPSAVDSKDVSSILTCSAVHILMAGSARCRTPADLAFKRGGGRSDIRALRTDGQTGTRNLY